MKKVTMFAVMAAIAFAAPVHAAEKVKKEAAKLASEATAAAPAAGEPQKTDTAKPLPFQGKVASVDASAKTFTTKNKDGKEHVFTVTDKTQITKADGSAGKFDDIKVDEAVRGSRLKTGENKWEAVKVSLGEKPGKEAKKAEAKPEEKK